MTDRPAAQLLAEWLSTSKLVRGENVALNVAWNRYGGVLRRLVEAEQALAEVEAIVDGSWDHDDDDAWSILLSLRAALRASQGGQT